MGRVLCELGTDSFVVQTVNVCCVVLCHLSRFSSVRLSLLYYFWIVSRGSDCEEHGSSCFLVVRRESDVSDEHIALLAACLLAFASCILPL
jgi:hypothetical protein